MISVAGKHAFDGYRAAAFRPDIATLTINQLCEVTANVPKLVPSERNSKDVSASYRRQVRHLDFDLLSARNQRLRFRFLSPTPFSIYLAAVGLGEGPSPAREGTLAPGHSRARLIPLQSLWEGRAAPENFTVRQIEDLRKWTRKAN